MKPRAKLKLKSCCLKKLTGQPPNLKVPQNCLKAKMNYCYLKAEKLIAKLMPNFAKVKNYLKNLSPG